MAFDPILKSHPTVAKSDYAIFDDEKKRREIIIEYVNFIKELGYTPVKVFGNDMYDIGVSFRALFEFMRPIEAGSEKRKHTCFFEARDYSDFSLDRFNKDVLETTEMATLENFKKALRIRLWNSGFQDSEILAAVLSNDRMLKIEDVYIDGKVVIPKNAYDYLFNTMNFKGGAPTNSRVIRRHQNDTK